MPFVRPKPIPLLMTVVAAGLMCVLGFWQVERLIEKELLIHKLEKAAKETPLESLPTTVQDWRKHRFYNARISGRFLPIAEFHIAARYHKGTLGYHVFNPFQLDDGRIVLVNRGWIPTELKDKSRRDFLDSSSQTLLVQIRTSNERNYFTPENQPDENIWFGRDMGEMRGYSGILIEPFSVDVIGEVEDGTYPIPSGGKIKLHNNHLGYAITWFAIGFGVLFVSLMYHRKKPAS